MRRSELHIGRIALPAAAFALTIAQACSSGESRDTETPTVLPTHTATATATPTPEATATPDIPTPEVRMYSFAREVLKAEYFPNIEPDKKEVVQGRVEIPGKGVYEIPPGQRVHAHDYLIDGRELYIEYFESVKGERYEKDGIPLALLVIITDNPINNRELTPENAGNLFKKFFNVQTDSLSWEQGRAGSTRVPFLEAKKLNPADNTLETLSTIRWGRVSADGNGPSAFAACKMYPGSGVYEANTCLPLLFLEPQAK